jgi:hypothetical protein
LLADGPTVSQPTQPQVLAQQLPQVARFQVSNIVAENQTILRRLSSVPVFLCLKSRLFLIARRWSSRQPADPAAGRPLSGSNIVAENQAILRR